MATKTKQKRATVALAMRNDEILAAHGALLELSQMRLPLATSMAVRRLLRAVGPVAEDIQEERRKLVREYALLDDDGEVQQDERGMIEFGDNRETYGTAHRELMALQADIEAVPIAASQLGVKEVQAALLVGLGDLLVDDLG